ncbi:hypothetical protein SUGI_1492180 [Cryptomeria japonica]|uniref:Uncharacterized protein n=1 Tax=Cryptomeria japonica TaxID=3369 RepID=A0AAD3NTD3_CRYJA|nr:hypothetical protein SUGI_1492180 [Cryptomeria japonica]
MPPKQGSLPSIVGLGWIDYIGGAAGRRDICIEEHRLHGHRIQGINDSRSKGRVGGTLPSRSGGREKEGSAYPTTAAGDGEEPVEYDDVMKYAGRAYGRSIYSNTESNSSCWPTRLKRVGATAMDEEEMTAARPVGLVEQLNIRQGGGSLLFAMVGPDPDMLRHKLIMDMNHLALGQLLTRMLINRFNCPITISRAADSVSATDAGDPATQSVMGSPAPRASVTLYAIGESAASTGP